MRGHDVEGEVNVAIEAKVSWDSPAGAEGEVDGEIAPVLEFETVFVGEMTMMCDSAVGR